MKNKPLCEYIRLDNAATGETLQLRIDDNRRKCEVSATLTKTTDVDKYEWCFYDKYCVQKACFIESKNMIPHFDFPLYENKHWNQWIAFRAFAMLNYETENMVGWSVTETQTAIEFTGIRYIQITMKFDPVLNAAYYSLGHGKGKRFHPYTEAALDAKIAKLLKPKKLKEATEEKGIEVTTADIMTGIGTIIMSSFIRKNGIPQDVLDKVKAGNCVKLDGTIVDNPFKPLVTVGPQDTMRDSDEN